MKGLDTYGHHEYSPEGLPSSSQMGRLSNPPLRGHPLYLRAIRLVYSMPVNLILAMLFCAAMFAIVFVVVLGDDDD